MRKIAAFAALGCALAGPAAHAQDSSQLASVLVAATESLGQAMGSATANGSNVFVTATGHASLSTPADESYTLTIQGRAKSAVEATRQHEDRIKAAQRLAIQFHVVLDVGSTSFTSQIDSVQVQQRAAQARAQAAQLRNAGAQALDMPLTVGEFPTVFVVSSQVRFTAADRAQFAAFLDALGTAGALDNGGGGFVQLMNNPNAFDFLGLGTPGSADDAVWDKALADAMAAARREAQAVAAQAGRQLGDVKQVSVLARSVRVQEASVTVAVSYAFAPPK
jgi:hypothetical protein